MRGTASGGVLTRLQTMSRSAQSTLEYAILVSVVSAALVAMHTYVRRAIQANLKTIEEELNAKEVVR